MMHPFISVISPTYHDWDRLALCLKALEGQSYPADSFEIIIANNDPADAVPEGFHLPANCRIITEGTPGSYAARNAAIKVAQGEIFAFTDSDCIPDKDWLKNAVEHFSANPDCSRIAGRVELFYKDKRLTPAELFEKVYAFNQIDVVRKLGTSVTANMISYKKVFDAVGPFNINFLSGGDYEWGQRAHAAGFRIAYVPNVVVKHPARYYLSELVTKAKRVTGGEVVSAKNGSVSKTAVLRDLLKPYLRVHKDAKAIFILTKGVSFLDKLKIFGVRYYLIGIKTMEKIKVYQGKKPVRL